MESTPSDELIHSDQIELLKAAMPYLPKSGQQFASVFAKFLELQETFHVFLEPQGEMHSRCAAFAEIAGFRFREHGE